jgi:NAD(P)H-hydrate repair Nnr-like enzyme with NAD(P)H-hydrate dehydratase domain
VEVEIDDALLTERFPLPRHDDHESKHDRGTVLVVAEVPGAALLAGVAALRVGAGRLRLWSDSPALAVAVPEARVSDDLDELLDGADAVLLAADVSLPPAGGAVVVADAAGLRHGGDVLLPNESEAGDLPEAPVVAVRGAVTRVRGPDGETYVERGGGIALATSGSGDVLAGLVTGLVARGAAPLTATLWAVHLHAAAGDRLPIGTLARELIDEAAAPLRRR